MCGLPRGRGQDEYSPRLLKSQTARPRPDVVAIDAQFVRTQARCSDARPARMGLRLRFGGWEGNRPRFGRFRDALGPLPVLQAWFCVVFLAMPPAPRSSSRSPTCPASPFRHRYSRGKHHQQAHRHLNRHFPLSANLLLVQQQVVLQSPVHTLARTPPPIQPLPLAAVTRQSGKPPGIISYLHFQHTTVSRCRAVVYPARTRSGIQHCRTTPLQVIAVTTRVAHLRALIADRHTRLSANALDPDQPPQTPVSTQLPY